MGLIAKQTVLGSIYTYAGAAIGFVSTGLLMPVFFQEEQVGLVNIIIALSLMFSQLGSLGFVGVITLLFPHFRDFKNKHNGILTLGFFFSIVGFLIILIVFIALKPYLIQSNYEKSTLLENNIYYVPVLIFFTILFNLFDNYNKVLYDTVSGTFLKELLTRLLSLASIVLFVLKITDFQEFIFLYVLANIIPAIILFILISTRGNLLAGKINKDLWKTHKRQIFNIALVWIIAGFSGIAIVNIDKYMVNYFMGLKAAGIYSVSFFFGVLVIMPSRALRKISSIVIADAWKNSDLKTISDIYVKSTINQLIVAVFLFFGIWLNIDNIFRIIPDYEAGKYVIFFIALSNVVDMAAGVSPTIISNSKYYKTGAYVMLFTIISVVILNILLIPYYGLKGAAAASLLTVFFAYLIRYVFILNKFKLQPYSLKHLTIIVIATGSYFVSDLIPYVGNLYFDIFLRSAVLTILFSLLIYFSRTSDDAERFINKHFINRFKPRR